MKFLIQSLVAILVLCVFTQGADLKKKHHHQQNALHIENLKIDMENGSILISCPDEDENSRVEITDTFELIINGDRVKTSPAQEKMLAEYYHTFEQLLFEAENVGLAGARIGIHGAQIGLEALSGVFRVLVSDLEEDELERRLERKAERLEDKAKVIERRAEKLEVLADELEAKHLSLRENIPELDDLNWW